MDGGHSALGPAAAASGDARRPRGPDTALWAPRRKEGQLPPLQPSEHMTVGQVRHPELHEAFVKTFSDWWEQTAKWLAATQRGGKQLNADKEHVSSWTIECDEVWDDTSEELVLLSAADRMGIRDNVARLLGWSNIKVKHLRDLTSRLPSADEALGLLLRGSRRRQREDAGRQAQQQQQQPGAGSEDEDEGECVVTDTWFELPADVPVDRRVVPRLIGQDDPRQGLRGGRGLFATRDLPRLLVLGPYRSYCMFDSTYEALTKKPPPDWKQTPGSWRLQMESYACGGEHSRITHEDLGGTYSLVHSGWGYGNGTAYANDPHLNPLEHVCTPGKWDDYMGPCLSAPGGGEVQRNAVCIVVRIMGWPYLWMCTTKEVPAGCEVLCQYGATYWKIIDRALSVVKMERATDGERAELRRQLEDQRQQVREQSRRLAEESSQLTEQRRQFVELQHKVLQHLEFEEQRQVDEQRLLDEQWRQLEQQRRQLEGQKQQLGEQSRQLEERRRRLDVRGR